MALNEVAEGIKYQGVDESISYRITTTNWGSDPINPSAQVFDEKEQDATSRVMPTNSPSVAGDVITVSPLKNLSYGNTYRVEVKFEVGSSVFECFFRVTCER